MSAGWDAVTAISSAVTCAILLVTVMLARRQLELLRRSAQLEGMIAVLRQVNEPRHAESYRFVMNEFETRMRDPEYRRAHEIGTTDESVHKELPTLAIYEQIGAYVHFGLIDADAVYCQAGSRAVRCWEKLQEVVAIHRRRAGPGAWDNYERFVHGSIRFARRTNPNYPGPYLGSEAERLRMVKSEPGSVKVVKSSSVGQRAPF